MPRRARYALPPLGDLRRQLQYAPAETRLRQMEAAEALSREIEPAVQYPEDFVLWRITGYRRDSHTTSPAFPGDVLLGDLMTFIREVSSELGLKPDARPGGAFTIDEVARELGVSLRSIQRYRRLGLVCHEINFGDGLRTGCFLDSIRAFRERHPELVNAAASFSRVDEEERDTIIRAARALRGERPGLTLTRAARELGERFGRSHETVRTLLRRHDASARTPIFPRRRAFDAKERRLVERAWRRGIPVAAIAERLGRPEPTVHRHLVQRRCTLLASVAITWVDLPTFALPDAEEVILGAPAATSGLERTPCGTDAIPIIDAAARAGANPPTESDLDAMVAAMNLLRWRAAEARRTINPASTAASTIDAIETDLRWASLLRHRLVLVHLLGALRRIEAHVGQPIIRLTPDEIATFVPLAVRLVAEVAARVDPSRGQRMSRIVALEMDKALARHAPVRPQRAGAMRSPAGVAIADPFARLDPWQEWLDPPPWWAARLDLLHAAQRRAVERRFGLDGGPPSTIAGVARSLRTGVARAARLVTDGERRLRTGR